MGNKLCQFVWTWLVSDGAGTLLHKDSFSIYFIFFPTGRMYNNRHRGLGSNQNLNGKISHCEGKQSRGGSLARHSVLVLPLSV